MDAVVRYLLQNPQAMRTRPGQMFDNNSEEDSVLMAKTNDEMVSLMVSEKTIQTKLIETAFRSVDRCHFVPESEKDQCYSLLPLRDGLIHISAPPMYAKVLENLLPLKKNMNFLNIGSGTGYFNCIMANILDPEDERLCLNHGIDIWSSTIQYAEQRIQKIFPTSCCNVVAGGSSCVEDLHAGRSSTSTTTTSMLTNSKIQFFKANIFQLKTKNSPARYDRIYLGSCAPSKLKPKIYELLEVNGVLVGPFALKKGHQMLRRVTRVSEYEWETKDIEPVQFAALLEPHYTGTNNSSQQNSVSSPAHSSSPLQHRSRGRTSSSLGSTPAIAQHPPAQPAVGDDQLQDHQRVVSGTLSPGSTGFTAMVGAGPASRPPEIIPSTASSSSASSTPNAAAAEARNGMHLNSNLNPGDSTETRRAEMQGLVFSSAATGDAATSSGLSFPGVVNMHSYLQQQQSLQSANGNAGGQESAPVVSSSATSSSSATNNNPASRVEQRAPASVIFGNLNNPSSNTNILRPSTASTTVPTSSTGGRQIVTGLQVVLEDRRGSSSSSANNGISSADGGGGAASDGNINLLLSTSHPDVGIAIQPITEQVFAPESSSSSSSNSSAGGEAAASSGNENMVVSDSEQFLVHDQQEELQSSSMLVPVPTTSSSMEVQLRETAEPSQMVDLLVLRGRDRSFPSGGTAGAQERPADDQHAAALDVVDSDVDRVSVYSSSSCSSSGSSYVHDMDQEDQDEEEQRRKKELAGAGVGSSSNSPQKSASKGTSSKVAVMQQEGKTSKAVDSNNHDPANSDSECSSACMSVPDDDEFGVSPIPNTSKFRGVSLKSVMSSEGREGAGAAGARARTSTVRSSDAHVVNIPPVVPLPAPVVSGVRRRSGTPPPAPRLRPSMLPDADVEQRVSVEDIPPLMISNPNSVAAATQNPNPPARGRRRTREEVELQTQQEQDQAGNNSTSDVSNANAPATRRRLNPEEDHQMIGSTSVHNITVASPAGYFSTIFEDMALQRRSDPDAVEADRMAGDLDMDNLQAEQTLQNLNAACQQEPSTTSTILAGGGANLYQATQPQYRTSSRGASARASAGQPPPGGSVSTSSRVVFASAVGTVVEDQSSLSDREAREEEDLQIGQQHPRGRQQQLSRTLRQPSSRNTTNASVPPGAGLLFQRLSLSATAAAAGSAPPSNAAGSRSAPSFSSHGEQPRNENENQDLVEQDSDVDMLDIPVETAAGSSIAIPDSPSRKSILMTQTQAEAPSRSSATRTSISSSSRSGATQDGMVGRPQQEQHQTTAAVEVNLSRTREHLQENDVLVPTTSDNHAQHTATPSVTTLVHDRQNNSSANELFDEDDERRLSVATSAASSSTTMGEILQRNRDDDVDLINMNRQTGATGSSVSDGGTAQASRMPFLSSTMFPGMDLNARIPGAASLNSRNRNQDRSPRSAGALTRSPGASAGRRPLDTTSRTTAGGSRSSAAENTTRPSATFTNGEEDDDDQIFTGGPRQRQQLQHNFSNPNLFSGAGETRAASTSQQHHPPGEDYDSEAEHQRVFLAQRARYRRHRVNNQPHNPNRGIINNAPAGGVMMNNNYNAGAATASGMNNNSATAGAGGSRTGGGAGSSTSSSSGANNNNATNSSSSQQQLRQLANLKPKKRPRIDNLPDMFVWTEKRHHLFPIETKNAVRTIVFSCEPRSKTSGTLAGGAFLSSTSRGGGLVDDDQHMMTSNSTSNAPDPSTKEVRSFALPLEIWRRHILPFCGRYWFQKNKCNVVHEDVHSVFTQAMLNVKAEDLGFPLLNSNTAGGLLGTSSSPSHNRTPGVATGGPPPHSMSLAAAPSTTPMSGAAGPPGSSSSSAPGTHSFLPAPENTNSRTVPRLQLPNCPGSAPVTPAGGGGGNNNSSTPSATVNMPASTSQHQAQSQSQIMHQNSFLISPSTEQTPLLPPARPVSSSSVVGPLMSLLSDEHHLHTTTVEAGSTSSTCSPFTPSTSTPFFFERFTATGNRHRLGFPEEDPDEEEGATTAEQQLPPDILHWIAAAAAHAGLRDEDIPALLQASLPPAPAVPEAVGGGAGAEGTGAGRMETATADAGNVAARGTSGAPAGDETNRPPTGPLFDPAAPPAPPLLAGGSNSTAAIPASTGDAGATPLSGNATASARNGRSFQIFELPGGPQEEESSEVDLFLPLPTEVAAGRVEVPHGGRTTRPEQEADEEDDLQLLRESHQSSEIMVASSVENQNRDLRQSTSSTWSSTSSTARRAVPSTISNLNRQARALQREARALSSEARILNNPDADNLAAEALAVADELSHIEAEMTRSFALERLESQTVVDDHDGGLLQSRGAAGGNGSAVAPGAAPAGQVVLRNRGDEDPVGGDQEVGEDHHSEADLVFIGDDRMEDADLLMGTL
ncbi:unnamed protein product [Amoebophrya sp. A120]|nr:unnamed protein product [Amoebophrya sp. A120]|eukprot:GSA120T00008827001.1